MYIKTVCRCYNDNDHVVHHSSWNQGLLIPPVHDCSVLGFEEPATLEKLNESWIITGEKFLNNATVDALRLQFMQ